MIQGGEDVSSGKDIPEQSPTNGIQQVNSSAAEQAPVARSPLSPAHRQRIVVSQTYSSAVAAAAHAITSGTEGSSNVASGSDSSLQRCFISGVPVSGQLQNVTIPATVTGSLQEGAAPVSVDGSTSSSSFSLSSPQNLARILAAANPNCSVRTGGVASQNVIVGVSAPSSQSELQLVNSPTMAVNVPNLQLPAVCCAVITLPVTTTSIVQKPVMNGGRQENLSLRLASPSLTSSAGHQTLILGSASGVQPDDVTRVHSYSLASASSSLVPSSNLHLQDIGPNRVVLPIIPSQKSISTSNHAIPAGLPLKRGVGEASSPVSTVNKFGSAVTNMVSPVNNLTPFSTSGYAFVTTSNPQNTVVGPSIPNFSSHRPKRIKLEVIPPPDDGIAAKRRKICDYRLAQLKSNRERYCEELIELFFLQSGGNLMDFWVFRKRPISSLLSFLRANVLDSDDEEEQKLLTETKLPTPSSLPTGSSMSPSSDQGNNSLNSEQLIQLSKSIVSSSSSSQFQSDSSHLPLQGPAIASLPESSVSTSQIPTAVTVGDKSPKQTSSAVTSKMLRQHSISAVYDSSIGSQEEIVERAKQEAYVMQRISELRKEGLWSMKRLPKVQEPPRTKAQWDYLLEEMVWLATDFAQERKWKKAAAKKCARMVLKFHQEKEMKAEKAEKEEQMKLRKIASQVAKEIKQFWANIEKLVEYKQNTLLEEKRKKFLDLHLNFIVDQTEKYSSWLAQGMNRGVQESNGTSRASSPTHISPPESPQQAESVLSYDNEFLPENSESDDEETIEKEEENVCETEQEEEIKLLQAESEVPLEELLESLPPEIFEKPASLTESETSSEGNANSSYFDTVFTKEDVMMGKVDVLGDSSVEDDEFTVSSEEEDDESTIQEQEKREGGVDYNQELRDLQAESELPIEDLYLKYANAYASDFEVPESDDSNFDDKEFVASPAEDKGSFVNEDKDVIDDTEVSMDVGESSSNVADDSMQDLISQDTNSFEGDMCEEKNPSKEITDIAATAERFQPKGNTLSTTQVCTKVPFLLKHQLREYQHIGLDWLNAMYDKKLNGILADEMGLGKTIQTISVLAHLACEKGIWGPHLIVVPTSVMLNWEMEFKKWCPGFKILTYYGTPKERKQKRMGWTKPNAFHVCITSYKVVIQDHHSFRRKKWKYFILDEAQNIKNFRSQRWQMLLNFQSSHRLLLTGTPLQNSLVELWSLMHFLMPTIFQSHREFKEWFVNPVSGMIEGNVEYNEGLIKRLHKVLRPFLLRRLKSEVEKQLPKKYEHIIMCRLSKRQRYLYDDFMAQTKTKETLATGNFMSVINVLMQLRKVCNHPNMFEVRPVVSPFMMERIRYHTASLVWSALDYDPFKHVSLWALNLLLADLELCLTAFAAHRIKKFQTPPRLIEEIDSQPDPPPRCPAGKIRLHVQNSQVPSSSAQTVSQSRTPSPASGVRLSSPSMVTRLPSTQSALANPQRYVVMPGHHSAPSSRATSPVAAVTGHQIVGQQSSEYTLQLLQQPAGGVPVAQLAPLGNQVVTSTPITVQIQQTVQGGARLSMPLGIGRLVQTSTGQHLLLTPTVSTVSTDTQHIATPAASTMTFAGATNSVHLSPLVTPGPMVGTATVLPQVQKVSTNPPVMPPIVAALSRPQNTSVVTALSQIPSNKPVGRVAPLNINPTPNSSTGNTVHNAVPGLKSPVVHSLAKTLKCESSVEKDKRTSLFFMETLAEKRYAVRRESLKLLGLINRQRCAACPIYGHDLIEAVTVTGNMKHYAKSFSWAGRGFVNCLNAPSIANRPRSHWLFTRALCDIIDTPEQCIKRHLGTINRFVFDVPAVTAPCIQMHMSHPPPSKMEADRLWKESLSAELSPRCALLHPIISNMKTQFPDLRLIEYDCGKLQRLSGLLWELKTNHHRVLIFTQMTRMLDILEQFLNYHGHTYLRLDGTTKVEERQALMETFNVDKRYFCFILSTRSGGIGVNLTGADTVIFYDSDWNPTMDAQAQDRCHRIGQTRDVHIYRLISEKTVEENILKKANQKRLLGDLAIEGGNFTTAFFKTNTIHELFGIEHQDGIFLKIEEPKPIIEEPIVSQPEVPEKFSSAQLEQALGMAEEELDLQAAKTAHAEAAAELAEFDESIPLDSDSRDNEEKSPAEEELEKLMDQLTPVEKYALQFLESLQDPVSEEQFELAKEEIEAQKKDWELERLKALKEEEERRSGLLNCDEDPLLSYGRPDAYDQVYVSINGQEEMPIWAPPTPPQDENDLYIDYSFGFCYEHSLMPESQLPPIYVKKDAKRLKVDPVIAAAATTRKQKVRKDDSVYVPRSLFDRPTAAVLKMRREAKMQKFKGLVAGSSAVPKPSFLPLRQTPALPSQQLQSHPVTINKPAAEAHSDTAEWLVHEDWAILQVIQNLQGLSLNLAVVAPAHFSNWDLVADAVNAVSRIYRSAKQCKSRYENVIVPREEGKILYDPNLKKQKKTKGIYKTKSNRPMRTSQVYQQDNNSAFTRLFCTRSATVTDIAKRHSPSMKTFTQSGKNPKHASVLSDSGINYDQPLTPMQVAMNRADRIAREKQKTQAVAAAQAAAAQAAAEHQLAAKIQQQHVQQQVGIPVPVAGTASITTQQAQAVIASLTQGQSLQTTQLGKTALPAGTVTTVSLSKPLGGGIMVNAAASTPGTFATISKALSGVSTVSAAGVTQNAASVCGLTSGAVRTQRSHVTSSGSTTTMAVQETVSTVASLARGLTTSSSTNGNTSTTPAVVSVAGLTAVQIQSASQRISASSLAAAAANVPSAINPTGTQVATTRNMSPSQLQVLRQTTLIRQQQRMQEMKQQQLKRLQVASAAQQVSQQAASGKVSVSSNSALSASIAAAANQQRVVHQQAAQVKQALGRAVTEAEMAQFLKRHQISQQKQAVAAQLQTQILAQAQLQQVQQQQVQASIAGAVQTPVATLVKTVSAPTSLGATPSVAIPVSAVTMAGVNINVSLPQGKTGSAPSKGATPAAAVSAPTTVTQQQLRQLQLQQQLLQQRKLQKVTSVAQLAKVAGKNPGGTTATLPSATVQILQHSGQAAGNQQGKSIQATSGGMTVQQIQQVIKQVLPTHIQVSNAQVTSGSSVTTTLSQNQLLSHHAVLQAAAAPVASVTGLKTTIASGHSASSIVVPSSSSVQSLSSSTPSTGSTASVQTRIIPVCQAAPASTLPSSQPNMKQQTIQLTCTQSSSSDGVYNRLDWRDFVSCLGIDPQNTQVVTASPNVTASLQGQASLRGEPGVMASGVKAQTTTLPSTTLTSAVLKGSPTVVVSGQQTTAAIIQQVTSSNASLLPSQAVTLAVRAAASQAQGQPQVQIQVQQTPTSLMGSQSQIQQLSQNSATINLGQSIPIQASTQVTSVLTPVSGINALPSSMTLDSTMTSPTHVVMSSPQTGSSIVMPPGLTSSTTNTAQVVQAALQAAKQQQQAAQQQQQRASPYTMRLRNPPKQ